MIVLDVTDVVSNWITALDSLLGDYSEEQAFKVYNKDEDTLFFDDLDGPTVYLIQDYLENLYIKPLDSYLNAMDYEIERVVQSNVYSDPAGRLVINLLLQVRNIHR